MAQDKRRRKKEMRDLRLAEQETALRRRRNARLAGLGLVLAVLVALAVFTGSDGDGDGDGAPPDEQPAAVACEAEAPPDADPQQYERPEDVLQPGTDYRAVIHTSCGEIDLDLLEQQAPGNVNNFVFLAREGFYDGLTFHRVINDFVIQAGDPNDQNDAPPNGPGYTVPDEFPDEAREYVYGVVAMANSGQPDSAGSQFFIVVQSEGPAGLDPLYSIFGAVEESSFETLEEIATVPTKGGTGAEAEEPASNVYIESIVITEA